MQQSSVHQDTFRVRFSATKILANIEEMLTQRDIRKLSESAYCFIVQHCGSAAAATPEIWKHRYSDLRDFIYLFLAGNELGQNISLEVCNNRKPKDTIWKIKRGIVDLCKRYKSEVFSELERKERNLSRQVAYDLLSGSLRLKDVSEKYGISLLSSSAGTDASRTASIREIVDALNQLVEKYEFKKIRAIFATFPIETIIAGNYVNSKYRYAVQAVIASAVVETTR